MRFAVFTASSALPLDLGYSADDKRCFTPPPHFDRNIFRAVEVNCDHPPVLISSGMPSAMKRAHNNDINELLVTWLGEEW